MGLICFGTVSCQSPKQDKARTEPEAARASQSRLDPGWPRANNAFRQVCYQELKAVIPKLEGAEFVNDDEMCATCHSTYAKSFAGNNVHYRDTCESCHGPASRHLETKGKEPGLIFSFKTGDPTVRAEACLRCHEQNQCAPGAQWRTSKHAQRGVTCVSCHRAHYDVPAGTPAVNEPTVTSNQPRGPLVHLTSANLGGDLPTPPAGKAALPSLRGTSHHLGAIAPGTCFRCHTDKQDLARIAGPHQICGPNGFNCTTCHDPHGKVREATRKDLCLSCHKGAPTMAWHASTHAQYNVACTDCHNPHPNSSVPQFVKISHTNVVRPKRLPMAVEEPESCYKCHQKIFGLNALPSHHPIKEGKMVCSDCHDPHGQLTKNLKGDTVNLLCYRCHAEKQGPFAYAHPPVTENCAICHEPHGTVANNLLRQPTTFLCLRCHAGHRNPDHGGPRVGGVTVPNQGTRANIDGKPLIRQMLYTDCTQCHAQVHGSDVPAAPNVPGVFFR